MKRLFKSLTIIALSLLFIECSQAQEDSSNSGFFEYKEIYLPEGISNAKQLKLNNLNDDWGIWGHHLSVCVPKNHSMTIYAAVGGSRNRDQYCFSSEQLYGYLENYIDENFSDSKTQRFAILPNDNDLVCQCDLCVKAGNTATDASPAVFNLIKRLAERFPNHIFFTSHYLTTRSLPKHALPENTGVLFSAIKYNLCSRETAKANTVGLLGL